MAKFNTKLTVAVALFHLSLLTFITARKVQVIRFRNDNASPQKTKKRSVVNNLSTTSEISFCFKIMPRFHRTFAIFKTEQLELWVRSSEKKYMWNINYVPLDATQSYHKIARMLPFCQSWQPGKWFSLCLSMGFIERFHKVKFYVNGESCLNQTYQVEETKLIHYNKKPLLGDL